LSQREGKIREMKRIIEEDNPSATITVVFKKDVARGVLEQSRDADLVLMGGRTGDFFQLLVARSLSQEITEQVRCPVLWVTEYEERPSFWVDFLRPVTKKKTGDQHEQSP
jgi:nucleotide-binding universal stress UspA family protein